MSYTYVILELSTSAFEEIRQKLEVAGYWQAFHEKFDGLIIDMHGIAVQTVKEEICMSENTGSRHPGITSLLKYFEYRHLPQHLQVFSQSCSVLAESMVELLQDSAELTAGLRKLLEAKDCFVRAALDSPHLKDV